MSSPVSSFCKSESEAKYPIPIDMRTVWKLGCSAVRITAQNAVIMESMSLAYTKGLTTGESESKHMTTILEDIQSLERFELTL